MHRIITIGREFGSGGRSIGRMAAERLGIPCYDQEIIEKMVEQSGMDPDYIQDEGEYAAHKSLAGMAYSYANNNGFKSNQDILWELQTSFILELAEKEDCVIVGRCADVTLKNRADLLRVFIHADFDKRAERIVEKYGETEVPTEKRLKEKDKRRALYYEFYTDHTWGSVENYDLILNSSTIGIDRCVDIICSLY